LALPPDDLIPRLQREILALDPEMPVADIRTMKHCGRTERSRHDELVQNSGRFTPERRAM
jgi:hypothetical protein